MFSQEILNIKYFVEIICIDLKKRKKRQGLELLGNILLGKSQMDINNTMM